MRAPLLVCLLVLLLYSQAYAQRPDSTQAQLIDSTATRQYLDDVGPAEAVFSFFTPSPFRFKSGIYTIGKANFPLLNSPDSLVQLPIERAYKQRRRARVSAIATVVPLAVLTYSVTRLVFTLGSVLAGRPSLGGLPDNGVIKASGIAAVAGITVMSTFNIASLINLRKGIRRHNSRYGRKLPTIFNPKGL